MDYKYALIVLSYVAFACAQNLLTSEFVSQINQQNHQENIPWRAKLHPGFAKMTVEEAKQLLGFQKDTKLRDKYISLVQKNRKEKFEDVPSQFDARIQWPSCIHSVLNQGDCGSCWAFGATESLTDRFCIQSNGSINGTLSVEQLVSCNDGGLEACNGGDPLTAFMYTSLFGLPLDSCFPYTAGENGSAPSCRSDCVDPNQQFQLFYSDLESITWHFEDSSIQADIFNNGPVEACFSVYVDFMSYSSGVYVHKSGEYLGGHCIKLIGWGHDDTSNLDYWIAQNSWGADWGMNGFFYIQRGVDMCGIDHEVWSVQPDI